MLRSNHRLVVKPINWLSEPDLRRYNELYPYISIEFVFGIRGTSTRFIDRIRPSNWFTTPELKHKLN